MSAYQPQPVRFFRASRVPILAGLRVQSSDRSARIYPAGIRCAPKPIKAYLQFARQVSDMIGAAHEKADLLERSATQFGLKGTAGQIAKRDGRVLLVSNDKKKCFEISAVGKVKYARFDSVAREAINPLEIDYET